MVVIRMEILRQSIGIVESTKQQPIKCLRQVQLIFRHKTDAIGRSIRFDSIRFYDTVVPSL